MERKWKVDLLGKKYEPTEMAMCNEPGSHTHAHTHEHGVVCPERTWYAMHFDDIFSVARTIIAYGIAFIRMPIANRYMAINGGGTAQKQQEQQKHEKNAQ